MKLQMITTTFPQNVCTETRSETAFVRDTGIEKQVINLYPDAEFQTFEGFGGAFTDAAGYVYAQMPEALKKELLSDYFTAEGMNYQFGRVPLDSCDFSVEQFEAMSDENDREMKSFSLEREKKYIFPMLKDAQSAAGKPIELMVTPWSPPAFMKTNSGRNHGGKLKAGFEAFWADYICRYLCEMRAEGLKINRISVQNEPAAVQTWDSCIYTAEEERDFLKNYLYPALMKNGLSDIEVYIWDHNKERVYERACVSIDAETDSMIAGLAVHWYSGDHFEALDLVRKRFPDKKLVFSEACIEYSIFGTEERLANAQKYAHDLIGGLNAGLNAFYDWNLLLDENGGPNHVGNNCDAPWLYDTKTHRLIRRSTQAYIRHFSHYIQPGAVRIGYSRYTAELDVTAFKNPDGTLVCVILNCSREEKTAVIRLTGETAEITVCPESISTVVIHQA